MRLESGRLKTYILHTATLKPKNKKGEDRAQTGDIPVGRVSESHTINHPGICFETLIWHSKTSLWHYNHKNKNEGGCDTRDTQVAMVSNLTEPHYRDFFFFAGKGNIFAIKFHLPTRREIAPLFGKFIFQNIFKIIFAGALFTPGWLLLISQS